MISGVYTNLEKRKISQETCKKFNYQVGKYDGSSVQIANYYDKNNNVVGSVKPSKIIQTVFGQGKEKK